MNWKYPWFPVPTNLSTTISCFLDFLFSKNFFNLSSSFFESPFVSTFLYGVLKLIYIFLIFT